MATISFGGLASGLDTDSIIQQLLSVEGRPITLLGQQRVKLQNRVDAYKDLNTRLDALENAAFELTKISNIVGRKATSSDSDVVVATANAEASPGSYQVEVLRLATSSRRNTGTGAGQGNTLGGISDATDFSGETLNQINSNNRLREDLTEGTFSVNGQQVLVTSSDTFSDILGKISTATSGAVTGSLITDPTKGGLVVELSSASQITVSSGTSNFLSVSNLNTASYSSGTLTSSDAVNAVRAELELDGSEGDTNLAQAVGSGTLTINGTSIDYNGANDSLNDIIQRINNANGNFRASLSSVGGGRVTLSSKDNGPQGISVADTGGLAAALGLTAADSQSLGQSAQIRVDNGAIQSFNKNSGITASGLDGVLLDLRDDDPGNAISVTVDSTSDAAAAKIKNFVDQFNNVIKRIDELTSYNQDTKQKGVLLADGTVSGIRSRLFDTLFSRIKGLNGSNSTGSLYEIGINTGPIGSSAGTTNQVQLDTFKLQEALEKDPLRVAQLLGATETSTGEPGVMERFKGYLDVMSNSTGVFNERSKVLKSQIEGINDRIDSLSTRLEKRQKLLEQQFTTLEQTLSRLQAQQSSLNNLFNRN